MLSRLEFYAGDQAVFSISISGDKGKKVSVHLAGYFEAMVYDSDGFDPDEDEDDDDEDGDDQVALSETPQSLAVF